MTTAAHYEALTRQIAAEKFPTRPDLAAIFWRMMRQESGHFNPNIVEGRIDSPAGARGIAQLMPMHWGNVDPLDPPAALRYGAGLLLDSLNRFGGDTRAAVAAYNYGDGNVMDLRKAHGAAWESYLPGETQLYLKIAFDSDAPAPVPPVPPTPRPAPLGRARVIASGGANLRAAPDIDSARITVVPQGTIVEIPAGEYIPVTVHDMDGYLGGTTLELIAMSASDRDREQVRRAAALIARALSVALDDGVPPTAQARQLVEAAQRAVPILNVVLGGGGK